MIKVDRLHISRKRKIPNRECTVWVQKHFFSACHLYKCTVVNTPSNQKKMPPIITKRMNNMTIITKIDLYSVLISLAPPLSVKNNSSYAIAQLLGTRKLRHK
jgi:hypothetical protein